MFNECPNCFQIDETPAQNVLPNIVENNGYIYFSKMHGSTLGYYNSDGTLALTSDHPNGVSVAKLNMAMECTSHRVN